jgi:hypothetical protein
MRAIGAAAHAVWSIIDGDKVKQTLARTATVVATVAIVLLASFVAVAIGLT